MEAKECQFDDLQNNPYCRGLFPELLHSDKYEFYCLGRLKGTPLSEEKQYLKVVYDKRYLISFLVSQVLMKLQLFSILLRHKTF